MDCVQILCMLVQECLLHTQAEAARRWSSPIPTTPDTLHAIGGREQLDYLGEVRPTDRQRVSLDLYSWCKSKEIQGWVQTENGDRILACMASIEVLPSFPLPPLTWDAPPVAPRSSPNDPELPCNQSAEDGGMTFYRPLVPVHSLQLFATGTPCLQTERATLALFFQALRWQSQRSIRPW